MADPTRRVPLGVALPRRVRAEHERGERLVDLDEVAAAATEVRMLSTLLRGALARLRAARGELAP